MAKQKSGGGERTKAARRTKTAVTIESAVMAGEHAAAIKKSGKGDLKKLLNSGATWEI